MDKICLLLNNIVVWGEIMVKNEKHEYLFIGIGSFLLAFSVEVFLLPSKISTGGISSIGTLLYYMFGVHLSITNIILNTLLFFFGYRFLGKTSLKKTIFGIVVFTVFLEIASYMPKYNEDTLASALAGGIFMGIGIGLVIRAGGSTGGSDFAGIIINKIIAHISVPSIIFIIDIIIIIVSGIFFNSITVIIYSGLSLFISAKISDFVLYIGNAAKQIVVISEFAHDIADDIINQYQRGATGMYAKGMYSKDDKLVIMCVVSPRQLPKVMNTIKQRDEKAFVVITDVKEVVGEGFN